ncbi:MAG: winged helix-turn-helix domain-containing protein [Streptosporangiales bacterium]
MAEREEPEGSGQWPIRDLTDPFAMRALAHPLRLRLLELLQLRGPLTATQCGDALGETPANCSFHLRTLAKYGYVEEAEGGTGRQRPWRAAMEGRRWRAGPSAPQETRAAADQLERVMAERNIKRLYHYLDHADDYGPEWSEAAMVGDMATYMTPAELDAVSQQLLAVIRPYLNRLRDPAERPEGSRPVWFFAAGFPIEPPGREERPGDA